MANNATHVWKWTGAVDGEWTTAGNWTDGADGAVSDYPDNALDTVTMVSSATNAMSVCTGATTVGTVTQGASYAGACCVANLTATAVTSAANGTVTGGTIATLTATGGAISGGTIATLTASGATAVSGGTITTAYASGTTTFTGGTIVTLLVWNSTNTDEQVLSWPTTVRVQTSLKVGGTTTFKATSGTTLKVLRRGATVTFDLAGHTVAGTAVVDASGAYGFGSKTAA